MPLNIGQDKKISAFWNAVIASVIMVATALILKEDDSKSSIILFEGVLFGVKTGGDIIKNYTIQRKNT